MIRTARILALLCAATACHDPYSNEDLVFLYNSVPDEIEVAVPTDDGVTGVNAPGASPSAETALFYRETYRAANDINQDVLSLVALIDDIVAQPPTERRDDTRVWGPIPDRDGVQLTLIADRIRTSTVLQATSTSTPAAAPEAFTYVMLAIGPQQSEPVAIVSGQQVPEPSGVQGTLVVDVTASRSVYPSQVGQGQVVVGYDTRFGQLTLELALGELFEGFPPTASWRHTRTGGNAGTFLYFMWQNFDPTTPHPELWSVAARWRDDGQGRADVAITNGDLALPLFVAECWDSAFRRTYLLSNIPDPAYFPVGTVQGCAPDLRDGQFPE